MLSRSRKTTSRKTTKLLTVKSGRWGLVASLLGVFLLVGAIASGVILTLQQQDINEEARGFDCQSNRDCPSGYTCSSGFCVKKQVQPVRSCRTNADCGKGSLCRNGRCQEITKETPRPTSRSVSMDCEYRQGGVVNRFLRIGSSCTGGNDCVSKTESGKLVKVCDPGSRLSCANSGKAWCVDKNNQGGHLCCPNAKSCNANGFCPN